MKQLADQLLPVAAKVDRLASKALEQQLAPLGISLAQFRIIGALVGDDEGISQRQLAERIRVEPATMSIALAKLEAAGVIERRPDPDDARARRVRCARRIPQLEAVIDQTHSLEKRATRGISKTDLATAKRVLSRVVSNLEEL